MSSITTRKGWAASKPTRKDRLPSELAAAGHLLHLPAAARSAAEAVSEVLQRGVVSHSLAGCLSSGKKSVILMWPSRLRSWWSSSATMLMRAVVRGQSSPNPGGAFLLAEAPAHDIDRPHPMTLPPRGTPRDAQEHEKRAHRARQLMAKSACSRRGTSRAARREASGGGRGGCASRSRHAQRRREHAEGGDGCPPPGGGAAGELHRNPQRRARRWPFRCVRRPVARALGW